MGNMIQVLYRSCGRDGIPSIVVDSTLLLEYCFFWQSIGEIETARISSNFVDGAVLAARIVTRVLYWALWWA